MKKYIGHPGGSGPLCLRAAVCGRGPGIVWTRMNMAERPAKRTGTSASRIPKGEGDAAGASKAAKAADAPEAVVEPMTVASITDYPAALTEDEKVAVLEYLKTL